MTGTGLLKAPDSSEGRSGQQNQGPTNPGSETAGAAARMLAKLSNLSTAALSAIRKSLSHSLGQSANVGGSPDAVAIKPQGPELNLEQQLQAALYVIDFALYGDRFHGLHEIMPPRSIWGSASRPSIKAYWEEVLGCGTERIAELYLKSAPHPSPGDLDYIANRYEQHTELYLRTAAASDPTVIERAVMLLPHYTQFCGATRDPHELDGRSVAEEVERLNRIFSEHPLPPVGQLQVNLIETDRFGTLEVSRHVDFDGSGKVHYAISKDGVGYGISEERGLTGLAGLFPELAVIDPRSLQYPSYSELVSAMEREGRDIRWDVYQNQKPYLRQYEASGPKGFRYCSYEAQQSLAEDLPGKDKSRIDVVCGEWNRQIRFDVLLEAARSLDVNIREHATDLLGFYPESIPFLGEALNDRSPRVVEAARRHLESHPASNS